MATFFFQTCCSHTISAVIQEIFYGCCISLRAQTAVRFLLLPAIMTEQRAALAGCVANCRASLECRPEVLTTVVPSGSGCSWERASVGSTQVLSPGGILNSVSLVVDTYASGSSNTILFLIYLPLTSTTTFSLNGGRFWERKFAFLSGNHPAHIPGAAEKEITN